MTYTVDDFSRDLTAVVRVEDPTDSMSKGRIDVLDRKTSRRLVSVDGEGLPLADLPRVDCSSYMKTSTSMADPT